MLRFEYICCRSSFILDEKIEEFVSSSWLTETTANIIFGRLLMGSLKNRLSKIVFDYSVSRINEVHLICLLTGDW